MKTIITKYFCVAVLIVSLLVPSSVGAYTQADIDSMFGTLQSLLAQVAQLIANRNNLAEVATGACSISVFTAEKNPISSGSSTVLYWSAGSACTGGKLKGGKFGSEGISVNIQGERSTGDLTQSTTYTLSFGSTSKTVTVSVGSTTPTPPPSTKFIIGDSVQVNTNLNVRATANGTILGQQVLGATGKVIGGPITVQSSNESSTWWNIDYTNAPDGWSFEPYLTKSTVSPPPPSIPTVTLSASPTSISAGQSATLTWSSTNATSCTASNGWTGTKATSGTQTVTPTANTTYTLTCTGSGGSANKTVTVSVNTATTPAPTVTFSASPNSISTGQSATLTWSSSDAASCTASGGWSGTKTTSGSESVSPTANTTYTLTCTGSGGSANQSATISVTTTPTPTVTLSASPTSISAGQSATLTWSSTNATSCTASNGWTGTKATSGTQTVTPTANTTYTLTCTGSGGSATQSVNVSIGTVTPPPPPPAGGSILTPSALLPAYGPLVAKKTTSIIPELATFDSRFLQYEKKHYDNYIANTSGTPAVGYNHYGFLGSRLNYAIRNGLPYGAGVTNEATDMYARGRRVTLDWLSTYAVPNNYAVAQWQNTALEDLEALVVLENNPIARTQIHIDAARGTDDKPYMKMQASGADPRGITIFLQPMLIAHRLGIPYVHPGNGYSGTFDKTLGSWSNAAKRNIYWLDQYNVIQSDGTIISNAHKGAEAYFMSAMLVNQLIGYYGYIERDPKVFSMIQRSVDHWINVLPAGWDALPYQSIDTSTGSNDAPAEDLAGFFVYPSLVMWQETGNQKYYDFAIKNIRAANRSWVAGYKQFNQVYNTDTFSAEALISGVHWKPAKPPYPPTGSVTPPPTNTPTVTLSASPTSISAGQSATLTWSSTNATSCTASNGWTGTKATSGTQTVTPTANTTYTLTCTGSGGSATQSVNVSIGTVTPPPTQKFSVGDTVQTTANLNVRGTAGGTILGQQPLGALGKVLAGPVTAGDGVWWNIDYVNAPDGWSFESFLVKSTVTPPPTNTPTVTLSANPTSVIAGSASTLTWSSTNATSCTASNGWTGTKATSGTQTVTPTANTTYTLTCTGSGGSASQSASVSVSSSNNKFIIGDSVQTTANLNVRGTPAGTILGQQPLGAIGKVIGGPTTVQSANELSTWWNIDYVNAPDGWSFEPYLTKSTVSPPPGTPTVTLSANPTSVIAGSASTLTWSSTNATSCTASNGWTGTKTTSGTQSVSLTATTTYTLTCTGSGGSAAQSVTVNVGTVTNPQPTVTLSASPTSISAGQSATLTWSSTNATSCTASNGWTGTKATSGTQTVTPTANTTYTLTCTGSGGSATKNVAVNMSAVTGPITLPIQPLIFQVPMPTQTGKLWAIPAGDSAAFQSALNQAQLGDTIELVAGSTYTGNFTFPKKTSGSGWIVVRTNKHTSLPPSGVRVGPSDAVNMAKIVSTNTGNTISFPSGSHHYRLIGLEVTNAISNTSYVQTAIVSIYTNNSNVADIPSNITLDRMYIHSQPTTNVQRCVHADGSYVAIVDSYLGECHAKGFDSQAIAAWNTNGPIKIVNNMLEGAGENVMFGGADPFIQGANPADIEIRNNYFYTPIAWKGTGGSTLWTKKNLFETKTGKRILIEGNVFDGSWSDGQVGHAFVIKSTNPNGKCTWCLTTDLTVRYNVVKNVGGTGGVSGNAASSNTNPIGGLSSRVLFEHNVFQNINVAPYSGVGRLIELYNNAQDVTYRNNTWDTMGGTIQHYISGGNFPTATNFTYMDNIAPFGQYGVVPGYTEATLKGAVAGIYNYSGNIVYTNQPSNAYSTSKYPTTPLYSNYSTALAAGKGADIPAVLAATKNAISGNGMGTTPPPISIGSTPIYAVANNPAVLGESTTGLSFARTLVKGMQGGDVIRLQEILRSLGLFTEEPTGYFGALTEQAVQKFQTMNSIVSGGTPETTGYGIVGPKTQQKLIELGN